MSTAIMQTGAMGWDYKFHDWNDSNDVGDIQLKVSNIFNQTIPDMCSFSKKFVFVLFLFFKQMCVNSSAHCKL